MPAALSSGRRAPSRRGSKDRAVIDDGNVEVPGARDVAEVLRTDPIAALLGTRLTSPWVLGVVLAAIVIAMVLLGPSTDSRFIYTDF